MKNKIVLIGCGNVGMAYAYALLNQSVGVSELVLIDINKDKVEGEAMDLNHCLAYSPSRVFVKAGEYSDCKDAKKVPMLNSKKMFEDVLKNGSIEYVIHRPTGYFYDIIKVFRPYIEKGEDGYANFQQLFKSTLNE